MWKAFAEHFKDCGRNGTLFIVALLGVVPLLLLISRVADELDVLAGPVLGAACLILPGGMLLGFIHARQHPPRLGRLPPLSRHDLTQARSKLMQHRTHR